ncbi:hypothetical protein C8R45DRAFT_464906 [Mycena sanguinolenta]|nr:hypothetical protein C8R45DRAFT_464906 [Mycena sanguinolenta]
MEEVQGGPELPFDRKLSISENLDALCAEYDAEMAELRKKFRGGKGRKKAEHPNNSPVHNKPRKMMTVRQSRSNKGATREHSQYNAGLRREPAPAGVGIEPEGHAPIVAIGAVAAGSSKGPVTQICTHCASTTSRYWTASPLEEGRKRCSTCYQYEVRKRTTRPAQLLERHRMRYSPNCSNCSTLLNGYASYSKIQPGRKLCKSCYKAEQLRHKMRVDATCCALRA